MCIVDINFKSKVIIMALINLNGVLMAITVLFNRFFMPMNLPNHLFMIISFKLMDTKLLEKKVEHFTAAIFSLQFSELFN